MASISTVSSSECLLESGRGAALVSPGPLPKPPLLTAAVGDARATGVNADRCAAGRRVGTSVSEDRVSVVVGGSCLLVVGSDSGGSGGKLGRGRLGHAARGYGSPRGGKVPLDPHR